MQPNLVSGQAIGTCVTVANSTDLGNLSIQGMSLGTLVYNIAVGGVFQLVAGSNTPVTDKIVTVSGVSGVEWKLVGLTVQPSSNTLVSAATDMTVSGLDGSTCQEFIVNADIITVGQAGALNITCNINGGVPGNAWSGGAYVLGTAGTPSNIGAAANLYITSPSTTNTAFNFSIRIVLGAKHGVWQPYTCTAFGQRATSPIAGTATVYQVTGQFKMASQVTSISIHSDVASAIDIGSTMTVTPFGIPG